MSDIRELLIDIISPPLLWVIFLIIVLIFIVVSIALLYHWKNYNVNSVLVRRLSRVYFIVSGAFLFGMLAAVIAYSL